MERFVLPANWTAMDGAFVEGIAEGIYRVTLPLVGAEERYVRVLSTALPPIGPAPVINEVMSDNDTAYVSIPGNYWDWIELYNPHDEAIALEGYGLSDDLSMQARWKFPAVTMQPGAHLLVHATDSTEPVPEGVLVAGFVLSPGGEPVVLTDRFGREVDRFDVPPLAADQSVGRVPDGGDVWQVFAKAQVTPGRTNGPAAATVVVEAPRFSLEAGFRPGPVDLVVADLSFISLATVLPALTTCASPDADIVPMVKPQFEVGKGLVGAGGVVSDPQLRASAVLGVTARARELNWETVGVIASPLPGPSGNVEYFLWLRARCDAPLRDEQLADAVRRAVEEGPQ